VTLSKTVSQNLLELRTRQGLSQEALAKRSRISVSYVSMLERGMRTPALETVESLAKALHVSPLYLLQQLDGRRRRSRRG
jgi:transcriptional regulator with XRE-family HTH domain